MHRTLKAEATRQPVSPDLTQQQQRFDGFVREYNEQRSHEALERRPPASVYEPSRRSYPEYIAPITYDRDRSVRRVRHNGEIKWSGHKLYLSEVLSGEPVGLQEIDTGLWEIRYSFHLLGYLDERAMAIHARPRTESDGKT